MNFDLNDDQSSILTGLDQLLAQTAQPGLQHAVTHIYSAALDETLAAAGYLDIAREAGFNALDAALVVERVARQAQLVEAGASALVAPLLPIDAGTRPIAMLRGPLTGAARFLPVARLLIVDHGDHIMLLPIDAGQVEPVETLLAYPYGRLAHVDTDCGTRFEDVAAIRRRWRIALAAEAAGCMAAALAAVIDHVTTRFAFGRPLGSFQAIHHRLAQAAETAESTRWLALRAAWSDNAADAALAAGFAQMRIAPFTYDLHQFSGAMGLTLEFPLHLWTYRLRALASELGGASGQAAELARLRWGEAA
ncbi:acyl-CoA dehydrogenase family protein [uncultured Sphingomonas sp.]|uniref:acyl-CoA dehydrogenase family protein n=1 Tax=uncultured Sphingomonas sp. TaxID=158754 RepID=UPI0035CC43A1